LCALGTPCIYYGTEQGFDGCGENDSAIRECMFDLNDKHTNLLNTQSAIYQAIATIARFRNESYVLRFGRMFVRELSNDGLHFHLPNCHKCTLAFSRVLFDQEVVFIYNSSNSEAKEECVLIDGQLNKTIYSMKGVYGSKTDVPILHCNQQGYEISYIKLELKPMELVILKNY
jgi:hypothetical protein